MEMQALVELARKSRAEGEGDGLWKRNSEAEGTA